FRDRNAQIEKTLEDELYAAARAAKNTEARPDGTQTAQVSDTKAGAAQSSQGPEIKTAEATLIPMPAPPAVPTSEEVDRLTAVALENHACDDNDPRKPIVEKDSPLDVLRKTRAAMTGDIDIEPAAPKSMWQKNVIVAVLFLALAIVEGVF